MLEIFLLLSIADRLFSEKFSAKIEFLFSFIRVFIRKLYICNLDNRYRGLSCGNYLTF